MTGGGGNGLYTCGTGGGRVGLSSASVFAIVGMGGRGKVGAGGIELSRRLRSSRFKRSSML